MVIPETRWGGEIRVIVIVEMYYSSPYVGLHCGSGLH
jgi:hypothetical protein